MLSSPSKVHEQNIVQQLLDALRMLPEAQADLLNSDESWVSRSEHAHEVEIDFRIATKSQTLLVNAKKSVYPRDVQQLLWRIKSLASHRGGSKAEGVPMLAAISISPGAKELLQMEQVGYFDSGGSLYLPTPGAYVYIDKPAPKAETSAMRSLFSGRRAQAIHTLLLHREQWFGVKKLAELAQVSPATASELLSELEKFDWITTRGQGPSKERHLREPGALLDAWATQVSANRPDTLRRYFVPGIKSGALVDRVAHAFEARGANYAVTHEAAAQQYAPFLSSVGQVRCRALPTSEVTEALADLNAHIVTEGANFAIIEQKSAGDLLFREHIENIWFASPVHVYLDLLKGEGRAKQMAEHLRKERIGF